MVEVFAGIAILCATAKQAGLNSSIAVDKTRKRASRCTILQLDLCNAEHQALLERWLQSPMLLWVHIAPVCGTASRARNIRRFANDPKPLRSELEPEGLSNLSPGDAERVRIANQLFEYSCKLFLLACASGTLVTMENPRGSYFWLTCWVLHLLATVDIYCGDFQVCMLGGARDKWTRTIGNFPGVTSLNIPCDGKHSHEPWGFAKDFDGKQVWATSLESAYPKKMCVALVTLVLDFAASRGLRPKAVSLLDDANPLQMAQKSQISAGTQPKPSRIAPVVADFSSVATFVVRFLSEIACSLMSKLPHDIILHTKAMLPVTVPKYSRFLRFSALSAPGDMGVEGGQSSSSNALKRKCDDQMGQTTGDFQFEVAFGLPWTYQGFIEQACKVGHPSLREGGVPRELIGAVQKHVEWSDQQLASFRISWCRKWMKRARELEVQEQQHVNDRHPEVAKLTGGKRLLLTEEMLRDIGFEDMSALNLLTEGATLAGEIEASASFESQYKPCLSTIEQLEMNASKMNEAVLRMTTSSGDQQVDEQLLAETELELEKGWADGPYELEQLEQGATISRRFPLVQSSKVRMIDDFSISGVNDSCEIHNKIDLHMIDTFCALVKHYFAACGASGKSCALLAKTYDLKSAYRQVPIKPSHYKFAYFSVYNYKIKRAQIYRLKTMPFGATHSVYCFLRLARMLYALATRGLFLLCTNFYDDFILASKSTLVESAKSGMEMIFLLTGWVFAQDGKKATNFSNICAALGVQFDFSRSESGLLAVCNTQARRDELVGQIVNAINRGWMDKQETLALRGRLGFADSFLHGRLGKLVLKHLVDHAYGVSRLMEDSLVNSLKAMAERLRVSKPRTVSASACQQWFLFTDASFEPESFSGGLGGVLVNEVSEVVEWFGIHLNEDVCTLLGAKEKGTIIYELEMLATVLATSLWCGDETENVHVIFGDNDSVRFSLIRACATGRIASGLIEYQLKQEARNGLRTWYARVPTEANLSDYPSRSQQHEFLLSELDVSMKAVERLQTILAVLQTDGQAR
eukprot:s2737_g20.t1